MADEFGLISKEKMTSLADAVRQATNTTGALTVGDMTAKLAEMGGEPEKALRCYDYDGTVVYEYTIAEALALDALPDPPANSDRLTFQGWNWSLEAIKEQFTEVGGYIDIGAVYITDDGATRLYVEVTDFTREPWLGFGVNGTVTIDWGDGSATDTMTGTGTNTNKFIKHMYSESGTYCISISGGQILFNGASAGTYLLTATGTTTASNDNHRYRAMLRRVHVGSNMTSHTNNGYVYCFRLRQVVLPKTCDGYNTLISFTYIPFAIISKTNAIKSTYTHIIGTENSTKTNLNPQYCDVTPRSRKDAFVQTTRTPDIDFNGIRVGEFGFQYSKAERAVGVSNLYTRCFSECFNLKNVEFASDFMVQNSQYAFYNCYKLADIELPDNITTLGQYMFTYCYSLEIEEVPESVNTLDNYVFQNCYSIRKFKLPPYLKTIGSSAFSTCYSLEEIELPKTLSSIGSSAFQNCYSLKRIVNNSLLPIVVGGSGSNYGYLGQYATEVIGNVVVGEVVDGLTINRNERSKVYAISAWDGVNKDLNLGDKEFDGEIYECVGLTVTTSPFKSKASNTAVVDMENVPNQLLYSSNGLTTLTIGDRVKNIGSSAFYKCTSLASISGLRNVETVGSDAFSSTKITSISLPHVKTIGSSAFQDCYTLEEIDLGDSLEVLSSGVFKSCDRLSELVFPATIREIGGNIFTSQTGLSVGGRTLDFRASSVVPRLTGPIGGVWASTCIVIVPDGLYDEWMTATNWSAVASRIVKASEYTE